MPIKLIKLLRLKYVLLYIHSSGGGYGRRNYYYGGGRTSGGGGNNLLRYGLIKATAGTAAGIAGVSAGILGPLALAALGK